MLSRTIIIGGLWMLLACSTAYAHGGIAGPDELGPPVITSAILGIVCYWAVMLWPAPRKRQDKKRPMRRAIR
jgi:hypothetical protein